ncbi:regakine-1-like [Rhinolophus ferrumequinum]|uniref:regakine-1-like n=1 Tax=Rhinolophus ferrumequinum TaxID=59479 RepID=UPI00140FA381|nr:regakine-1-like [Rhinolophus ferrumequinum]
MRVSLVLLAVLLTVSALHSEAKKELADNMPRCCYSYISRTIPLRVVTGYERTGSHCSLQGVMFLTKSGRKLCANPSNSWVQRHIRHLDQKSK